MSTDERDLVSQQPADVVQVLRESVERGYAVSFTSLAARITDADLADEARKAALVEAVSAKVAETMARGQFNDLQGARGFYDRLGIDHIELSEQIVATMRDLNDRVGDDVFAIGPTLYNGRTLDGLNAEQARQRQHEGILARAGYTQEQIPAMLPKLGMYRATIVALRAGPNSDFYEGFYRHTMPLFTGEQRNALSAMAIPRQLPPRRN